MLELNLMIVVKKKMFTIFILLFLINRSKDRKKCKNKEVLTMKRMKKKMKILMLEMSKYQNLVVVVMKMKTMRIILNQKKIKNDNN